MSAAQSKFRTKMVEGRVSPKAIVAGLLPSIGTILAIVIQLAITHEVDKAELVTALVGFSAAGLAALGAYLAQPGLSTIAGLEPDDTPANENPSSSHTIYAIPESERIDHLGAVLGHDPYTGPDPADAPKAAQQRSIRRAREPRDPTKPSN